jgi:hypothetical protein
LAVLAAALAVVAERKGRLVSQALAEAADLAAVQTASVPLGEALGVVDKVKRPSTILRQALARPRL